MDFYAETNINNGKYPQIIRIHYTTINILHLPLHIISDFFPSNFCKKKFHAGRVCY